MPEGNQPPYAPTLPLTTNNGLAQQIGNRTNQQATRPPQKVILAKQAEAQLLQK